MHHVAIMRPELGLLEKVLSGQKTIESRWLQQRRAPWRCVATNDVVYFKNSGEPVSVKATVQKVAYYDQLSPSKVKAILEQHGTALGLTNHDIASFYSQHARKKYGVLIWLSHVRPVNSPFFVNKKGFGAMSAWLTVQDIAALKIRMLD